jgi:hypothetical protein
MIEVYHLTTLDLAVQVLCDGWIGPGRFCDPANPFPAVFASEDPSFDWIERDVILPVDTAREAGVVLALRFSDDLKWFEDPEARSYGAWIYTPTTTAIRYASATLLPPEYVEPFT